MKEKIIIFIAAVCMVYCSNTHAGRIDSLEEQLNSVTEGSKRVALLNELSGCYLRLSVGKTIEYAYYALQLSQRERDTLGEAWSLYHLAQANAELYNYDIALEYIKRSARIFTSLEYNSGMVRSFAYMAKLKFLLDSSDKNIEEDFEKAIAIAHPGSPVVGYAYRLIGEFEHSRNTDKALMYYNKAYQMHEKTAENSEKLFDCYSLYKIYVEKGMIEEALKYLDEAQIIAQQLNVEHEKIYIQYSKGACYTGLGRYGKALSLQTGALHRALKTANWPRTIDCYLLLSETYSAQRKYDKAHLYFKRHIELKDSLIAEENGNRIDQLSLAYEAEVKEKLIEKQVEHLELQKYLEQVQKEKHIAENKRQKMFIGFFISIALFFLIATLYIYTRLLNKKNNEERLKQLVNATFEGILITDNQIVQESNQKITELSGFSENDLLNKNINILFEPKYSAEVANLYLDNEEKYEAKLMRNDGQSLDIEVLEKPFKYKGKNVRVIAIRDISERKKAELALISSEQQMVKLNAMKDKLFSIIGHDLKGTFGNFKLLFESFADDMFSFDKEQLNHIVHLLRDSSNATYSLLENLLNWAKIQRGQMIFDPQYHSLKKIVDESVRILSPNAITKQINMASEITEETIIYADKDMISTVCRNLIANAIKFTEEEGTVWISSLENGGIVEITVADTGVGIPKENLSKIFATDEHFTTYGTKKEKGSGLGLILCKEFVEQNGGKIWVESEFGTGSHFKFTLNKKKDKLNKALSSVQTIKVGV